MNPEDFLNEHGGSEIFRSDSSFSPDYEGSQKTQRFTFVPVSDLINNIHPRRWLIEKYLEEHTLGCIFGEAASGKSFIAIDMACCIATGAPWHGHKVKQGAVFYIAGEGHNGLAKRFKSWELTNEVSLDTAQLYVAERPAQFCNAESAAAVADAVQELANKAGQKPCLIVIDTLARNFGDGDENATKDMNVFVNNIDQLKNNWKAAALIIHHTGHADKERGRGSGALKAAMDHEYQVTKSSEDIRFHTKKCKESRNPDALYFQLVTVPVPHSEDHIPLEGAALMQINGSPPQKKGRKLSGQKCRAVDILRNCIIGQGERRNVRQGMSSVMCVTLAEYREALKIGNISGSDKPDTVNKAITRAINDLNNCGVTVAYSDYIWLADKLDKSWTDKNNNFPTSDRQDTPPIGVSLSEAVPKEGDNEQTKY